MKPALRTTAQNASAPGMNTRPGRFAPRVTARLVKALLGLLLIWLIAVVLTRGLGAQPSMIASAPPLTIARTIEWRPVAGSQGYLLQLRDQTARVIIERKLETSRTTVELPPGRYSLRVASLNKFGKPASWSAWAQINVQRPAPVDSPAAANTPDTVAAAVASEADARQPSANTAGLRGRDYARALIPGLSQYQRGQTWRGIGWMAAFGGLAAAGYNFWSTGNLLSYAAESATPLLLLSSVGGQNAASFVLLQQRAEQRAAYDAAQANQRTVGIIAGLLYLAQIADALWFAPEPAATDDAATGVRAGAFRFDADFSAPSASSSATIARHSAPGIEPYAGEPGFQFRFTTRF